MQLAPRPIDQDSDHKAHQQQGLVCYIALEHAARADHVCCSSDVTVLRVELDCASISEVLYLCLIPILDQAASGCMKSMSALGPLPAKMYVSMCAYNFTLKIALVCHCS